MRAFIAIELDPAIKAALAEFVRRQLRLPGIRWSTPEQLHVTLKFFGETARSTVSRIAEVMSMAASEVSPFEIEIGGLGGFPASHAPRILWIGVKDDARGLHRWLAATEPRFIAIGIPTEERSFHPHITLGRGKTSEDAIEMGELLKRVVPLPPMRMVVREVALFESVLSSSGPRYSIVRRVALLEN